MGNPYRRRADGELEGLALERLWPWVVGPCHVAPSCTAAERTRSWRWLAGTRRTKRIMRRYRS